MGYRDVLWIEGSPAVYARLSEILGAEAANATCRQRAVCALVSDREGEEAELRQTSNDGMSSSLFPLGSRHRSSFRGVTETGTREKARTRTLDSIAQEYGLLGAIDTLIVDVQGAELLALKGAEQVLKSARAVISEVSRGRFYQGGAQFGDVRKFLKKRGFVPMSRPPRHGDVLFLPPR